MVVQNVMRNCTGGKELKATVQFGEFFQHCLAQTCIWNANNIDMPWICISIPVSCEQCTCVSCLSQTYSIISHNYDI